MDENELAQLNEHLAELSPEHLSRLIYEIVHREGKDKLPYIPHALEPVIIELISEYNKFDLDLDLPESQTLHVHFERVPSEITFRRETTLLASNIATTELIKHETEEIEKSIEDGDIKVSLAVDKPKKTIEVFNKEYFELDRFSEEDRKLIGYLEDARRALYSYALAERKKNISRKGTNKSPVVKRAINNNFLAERKQESEFILRLVILSRSSLFYFTLLPRNDDNRDTTWPGIGRLYKKRLCRNCGLKLTNNDNQFCLEECSRRLNNFIQDLLRHDYQDGKSISERIFNNALKAFCQAHKKSFLSS